MVAFIGQKLKLSGHKLKPKDGKISFTIYTLDLGSSTDDMGKADTIKLDIDFNPLKYKFLMARIKDVW